ncbi:putative endoglucanase [Palleronia abyssalis]|uniref:cellulase n=2 Tax=Palleronia abyssalis TaxID=1501240 RepID=A0A2R8C0N7_9RHOB|nr:putative endoglucanase [Palleronia abyssalis]
MIPAKVISATAPAAALAGATSWQDAWEAWKAAFLTGEGRVVDALQEAASHSEGQGWGLVLAVAFDDAEAFARMFAWTERTLAVRQDALLAWRWRPGRGVTDFNNASDGDLFYAWALLRAARRFGVPAYADRARAVAGAIDAILVRESPQGGLLLRPAAERFSGPGAETINPSYYMPLALHALAAAFDLSRLARVADDGAAILARIAEAGLVPDWITVTPQGLRLPDTLSGLYGYDALRVPLYLIWSGRFGHPAVARARDLFASARTRGVPVRADLEGKATERSDAAGYRAVATLTRCTGRTVSRESLPPFTADQPYYPATLHLLALVAALETTDACVP